MTVRRRPSLLDPADPERPVLWAGGRAVSSAAVRTAVSHVMAALAPGTCLVNLCERRDYFLIAYCAALARGHTSLMPASRAPQAVRDVEALFAGSYRCDDALVASAIEQGLGGSQVQGGLCVPDAHAVEIAFTSGSTGTPQPHVKRWSALLGSIRCNASRIRDCLAPRHGSARPWIVSTVPPQHMYGTETTILLPLAAEMAVHAGRPLFPGDVAGALAEVPEPRVLVTTPVHLRALVGSGQVFPTVAVVVSATAPLDAALAQSVEATFAATVLEMFGSTETCVIATRRTAREHSWHAYPGITLAPGPGGTRVDAPWFATPTWLQDVIERIPPDRFVVRGRNADLIEVAGKRASLADLTGRLLALEGVQDGVVFQPEADKSGVVHRVAALAVAPGLDAQTLMGRLAHGVDAAFLPRPLVLVEALPRNELGKLVRADLLALMRAHRVHRP